MTNTPGSDNRTDLLSEIDPDILRGRSTARRVRVHVVDGPDRELVQEVTRFPLSIGTSSKNDLVLTDPTVSRHHLCVDCSDGVLVRDMESRNGTFLGELQIREALVPLGARLRIGRTVLCFLDADSRSRGTVHPLPEVPGLIGRSHAIQVIARSIRKIAPSNAAVLLQGETGTGKELVARAIHELGPRADGPFIAVDSGVLSPTLMASQLFGHERGAFTGADSRREGAFELARGGTLFLEIGDLPLSIQPALLGVLERKTFRRLGGKENIPADVRIISATHRDLRAEATEETFRSDLYFRLAVVTLSLPPLRERLEDLDPLIDHFVREIAGKATAPFSDSLMLALRSHRWAGNIRELRNVIENVLLMGSANLDPLAQMPAAARQDAPDPSDDVLPYRVARSEAVAAFEHHYIGNLIKLSNGNASKAARVAGMDRPYLLALLRKHGLRGPGKAGPS